MFSDCVFHPKHKEGVPPEFGTGMAIAQQSTKAKTERLLEAVYDEDLADFQAGNAYRRKYAQLKFPAPEEEFDEETVSGPRRLLSKVALKLRLKRDGVPYDPEDIDSLYEEGDVPEADYEDIAARLRAAG